MSLNNPISSGGLQSPNIGGSSIIGNFPSLVGISTRNYFLQQMESWLSTPASTTQWIVMFESFPETLVQGVIQELEYTAGDKKAWNVPLKRMTNYAFQKVIGCIFCQGMSLPKERINYLPQQGPRGFLGSPLGGDRAEHETLSLDFLETNLSFVDTILRPWVILTGHKGLVARPKGESIKTNITIIEYGLTNQLLAPTPRKVWTFHDAVPIGIGTTSHNYSDESVEIREGVEFAYSRYTEYSSTYVPIISLIDKFSNGGIDELADTIALDNSIKNLGSIV